MQSTKARRVFTARLSAAMLAGLVAFGGVATTAIAAKKKAPTRKMLPRKKSWMDNAPAIRHRYELRAKRFEIGPSFAVSLNRSLRNTFLYGIRLQYHINDFLAVGADVGFGFGTNWDAVLSSEIDDRYAAGAAPPNNLTPQQIRDRYSDVKVAGDIRLVFTPFSGKMSLFSKLFVAYDFYVFGGFGFGLIGNNADDFSDDDKVNATNEGFRPGISWGIGFKLFFTNFFALTFEFKDIIFADNETGQDNTRGIDDNELNNQFNTQFGTTTYKIDGSDKSLLNHFYFGLAFTFFFPTVPVISD